MENKYNEELRNDPRINKAEPNLDINNDQYNHQENIHQRTNSNTNNQLNLNYNYSNKNPEEIHSLGEIDSRGESPNKRNIIYKNNHSELERQIADMHLIINDLQKNNTLLQMQLVEQGRRNYNQQNTNNNNDTNTNEDSNVLLKISNILGVNKEDIIPKIIEQNKRNYKMQNFIDKIKE